MRRYDTEYRVLPGLAPAHFLDEVGMRVAEANPQPSQAINFRSRTRHNDVVVTFGDEPDHGFVARVFDIFMVRLVHKHEMVLGHLQHEFTH